MKKNILIAGLIVFVLGLFLLNSGNATELDNTKERLEACRTVALEVDTLLAEERSDYETTVDTIFELLDYQISEAKAGNIIDQMVDNKEKRNYRYQLTLDKYNHICFEL